MPRSSIKTDAFTNTNETNLEAHTAGGCTWALRRGVGAGYVKILDSGTKVGQRFSDGGDFLYVETSGTYTANQYALASLHSLASNLGNIGVAVRVSTDTGANSDSYEAVVNSGFGASPKQLLLRKRANDTVTNLDTRNQAFSDGDTIELEAVDNGANVDLNVYRNGTLLYTHTDTSSPLMTGNPGMLFRSASALVLYVDNWVGGNITAGDTTAPTLTSPTGTGGSLVGSGSVSTNEANGSLYAVATASATAPTAAQVKLGQDHTGAAALRAVGPQTVTATGVQNIASGAISAGTRYWHYMHEDAAANQSTVVSSASFVVTAPALSITSDPLKDQTDTLLASTLIAKVAAVKLSDMTVTATWTNQTTNGSGQLVVSDAALTAVPHLLLTSSSDGAAAGAKVYTPA